MTTISNLPSVSTLTDELIFPGVLSGITRKISMGQVKNYVMELVGTRWNFLGESTYNLKGSTYHPNPAGHQLWAEYIFNQIAK